MTPDIIGAGIGGLTMAIALEQKGISTRVFDQANKIKPIGAGIILANNAMQVFDKLGLREVIEENGNPIAAMNITKPNLQLLSKVDLTFFEKKFGVKNIAIHRGTLQKILVNKLSSTDLILNHRLSQITSRNNQHLLHFENGQQLTSPTLIGADGLNSIVRKYLFPNTIIRSAKQICWRGVCDFQLPLNFKSELNEAWGHGDRFGFVQIADNKVYWYALISHEKSNDTLSIHDLSTRFDHYNSIVQNIIASTPSDKIKMTEIADVKPTRIWYKNNACLIGDAAHAMTPNMGQGACQAIEDAHILSTCLARHTVHNAFAAYQKIRQPKAHHVVNTSWMIGKIAHLSNPIAVNARNLLMRLTPSFINRKQTESIFRIQKV